jgi:hypothetical protein
MLPSEHSYLGRAEFDNKLLGEDTGKFSVGEVNIEYLDLTMNYNLLKNITTATNGKLFNPNEISKLNEIIKRDDFRPYHVTNKKDFTLWSLPLILTFVILLFAIEWIIRKRKGLI